MVRWQLPTAPTYDLSIKGRKFAGLAQRIYQEAIAISAYISVSGNQVKRGQVVADFYAQVLPRKKYRTDFHRWIRIRWPICQTWLVRM